MVQTLTIVATVCDTSELDRLLPTKRRRITERQGVFTCTTEPEATPEELEDAQRSREQLVNQLKERERLACDESDVHALAAALREFGSLKTLSLEAAVDQGLGNYIAPSSAREWHPIWIRAVEVYRTVTLAIARSSVAIESLHIYKNSTRCSVPTWDVNAHMPKLESSNFYNAAQHIKSISLSVSTKVETDTQKIADAAANLTGADRAYFQAGMHTVGLLSESDPEATAEENYPGVARFLKNMPNLSQLDLHLYTTLKGTANSYAKVFSSIADTIHLPSLHHCSLRGLRCTEASLLKFLRAHTSLTSLHLHELTLVSGSWSPIFTHLSTTPPHFSHLSLHNLWKPNHQMLNLAPKHRPWVEKEEKGYDPSPMKGWTDDHNLSFACLDGIKVHTRHFDREEIVGEGGFEFKEGPVERQMGSPQFMAWIETRRAVYGPP